MVQISAGETFTVLGRELGGIDGVNNLTITVATIDVNGTILTVTEAGTMVNTRTPKLDFCYKRCR